MTERKNQEPTGAPPVKVDVPLDTDPLEGGGPVPGSPPGETFGSVLATPESEAERNEKVGRRRAP